MSHKQLYEASYGSKSLQLILGVVACVIVVWLLLAVAYDFGLQIPRFLVVHTWSGFFVGLIVLAILIVAGKIVATRKGDRAIAFVFAAEKVAMAWPRKALLHWRARRLQRRLQ